jgi:cell division protein FtsQ
MKVPDETLAHSPGRSWRNIRQEVKPVAMSRQGRRRQLLGWGKVVALCLAVAVAGWVVFAVGTVWSGNRAALASVVHSEPVRDIAVITEGGVLNKQWVARVLAIPPAASLMVLDLPSLRDKLLACGQVQVAVITRSFPDTLVVTLQERTPVARVQADDGRGVPLQLLVAKDGVVYDGADYDPRMLATLPWLDGIRLVRSVHGYEPIPGMDEVSALLSTAQLNAPHLYRGWLVVSLARLDSAGEILVRAQDIPEIVFSRKRPFLKQVAQLDYIIDRAHELADPALKSVNLTLDGQVPVVLEAAVPGQAPAAPTRPNFLLQPSQRKEKRDL